MDARAEPSGRPLLSCAAGLSVAALLLATSPSLPMVWDEGNAILRAEQIAHGRWLYTTQIEGHPALYGIVILAGHSLGEAWLPPLTAWRLGPILLFSVAAGAMFYRMARDYSLRAAVGSVAALVLMPRLFAHAHFASFDGPLTSCWILAWATFDFARRRWWGTVAWGIALGMTLSCKATGWLAPLPFLVRVALDCGVSGTVFSPFRKRKSRYINRSRAPMLTATNRDRLGLRVFAAGLPIALATFFLLNPPLWSDPVGGWAAFFQLNFNRAANPGLNISTWFLGRMYDLHHPLPWYNTLWWTLVSVPSGILALGLLGIVVACRRWRGQPSGSLLMFNWGVLLIVRALPGVPPHDGVRLFLPSFAFLAALAGVGTDALLGWGARKRPEKRARRAAAITGVVLLYGTGAVGLVLYSPQWLSYYNGAVGGLPGAVALGMEPTYYWDGLDRSVLDWLHENTPQGQKIRFGSSSPENRRLMRRWGMLRRASSPAASGKHRWYVFQRRPSGYRPADVWLTENAEPAFQKTLLGVPLVEVYREADYQQARQEVGDRW